MKRRTNLRFDGAIPPKISDKDVVCRDEVETSASSLDTYKQHTRLHTTHHTPQLSTRHLQVADGVNVLGQ